MFLCFLTVTALDTNSFCFCCLYYDAHDTWYMMQCPESEVFNKRMISMMREQWKFLGTTESAKSIAVGCPQFMRGKQVRGDAGKIQESVGMEGERSQPIFSVEERRWTHDIPLGDIGSRSYCDLDGLQFQSFQYVYYTLLYIVKRAPPTYERFCFFETLFLWVSWQEWPEHCSQDIVQLGFFNRNMR